MNDTAQITLQKVSLALLRKYRDHLWNVAKISLSNQAAVERLIAEAAWEVRLIERELSAEEERQR